MTEGRTSSKKSQAEWDAEETRAGKQKKDINSGVWVVGRLVVRDGGVRVQTPLDPVK